MNNIQKDVLREHINVFTNKAAKLLSEIANQRVRLNVPEISLLSLKEESITESETLFPYSHIVSSSMKFGNEFTGRAVLLFPVNKAKLLVDYCMGIHHEKDEKDLVLAEMDYDVIKEISNIMLNTIIGGFTNLLKTTVQFTVPQIELLHVDKNEQVHYLQEDVKILLIHTSFILEEVQVEGLITVSLGVSSLDKLLEEIDILVEEAFQ